MAIDWLMLKNEYLRTGVSLRALAEKHGVGRRALERAAADGGWAAERRAAAQGAKRDGADEGTSAGGLVGGKARATPKPSACAAGPSAGARVTGAKASGHHATGAGKGDTVAATNASPAARRKPLPAKASPDGEPTAPVDADTLARLRAISEQLTDQLARAAGQLDKQVLKHKRKTRELVYDGGDPRAKPVEETVEETCEIEIVDVPVSCEGLHRLSTTLKNLSDIVKTGGGDEQSVGMVAALMKKLDDEAAKGDA